MSRRSESIGEGFLVTAGSLVALAVAFALYFMSFLALEAFAGQDGSYGFVSPLRVGYGIVWLGLCWIAYRSRMAEWMKASVLAGSLATFMIGIGVQSYRTPVFVVLVMVLVAAAGSFLLHRMKKRWFHYYAMAISMIATLIYI